MIIYRNGCKNEIVFKNNVIAYEISRFQMKTQYHKQITIAGIIILTAVDAEKRWISEAGG